MTILKKEAPKSLMSLDDRHQKTEVLKYGSKKIGAGIGKGEEGEM
jgi:hypothetical protein